MIPPDVAQGLGPAIQHVPQGFSPAIRGRESAAARLSSARDVPLSAQRSAAVYADRSRDFQQLADRPRDGDRAILDSPIQRAGGCAVRDTVRFRKDARVTA
jgi:hypothetical protein